jgi:hypothetical protein
MKKVNFTKLIPHISALLIFVAISFAYFSPVLEGKQLLATDRINFLGMSKEIQDYEKNSEEDILWTNSMFSGMPTYQITRPDPSIIIVKIYRFINFLSKKQPVNFLFIYLLGFYIALLAFRINPWLSIAGAIAFAFSSYFLIIIEAGHNSKAAAIGFMPPIIAGVYLAYSGRIFLGSVLTGLFLALQLMANHLQITYYTLLIILIFGIFQLIKAIREKTYRSFTISTISLVLMACLAIASNLSIFWPTYEYSKYSIRGKSELISENGTQTSGLDKNYVTSWSYGIDETFTLFIPSFKGGSSTGSLNEKSKTYELFKQAQGPQYAKRIIKSLPLYWGEKPFTSGPVYVGSVILFLFIFGLFTTRGNIKWCLLTATIFSIVLAWGKNFMPLTNLFLDYFPAYNKFRTVEMILVIAEFAIPLLAIIALQNILMKNIPKDQYLKGLKYSLYGLGGLALFFLLFAGIFNFTGPSDQVYLSQGNNTFIETLQADRKNLFRMDSFRSLIFVFLCAAVLYAYYLKKINHKIFITTLTLLIIIDLWAVDKRYLNNDDFVPGREATVPFQPLEADKVILQDKDIYYRVYDLLADPFRNARTSYFHKSIGGYHGAKLQRYQDIIEHHLVNNNMSVINMLNTKYFILPSRDSEPTAHMNSQALGNAWFVPTFRIVNNANEEIDALAGFNPSYEAIIDKRFEKYVHSLDIHLDTTSYIQLVHYHPNRLRYKSNTANTKLAIFSDVYYEKGWKAYIDGELVPHFRANYILRAMVIPPGSHEIEFRFEPRSYFLGKKISLISSIILLFLMVFLVYTEIRGRKKHPLSD